MSGLADLKGQSVILYFYPKDDTSGCTREAIDFTAAAKAFKKKGAVVIGVSKDSVKAHDKFKTKHRRLGRHLGVRRGRQGGRAKYGAFGSRRACTGEPIWELTARPS